jgi:hypothetical protein
MGKHVPEMSLQSADHDTIWSMPVIGHGVSEVRFHRVNASSFRSASLRAVVSVSSSRRTDSHARASSFASSVALERDALGLKNVVKVFNFIELNSAHHLA